MRLTITAVALLTLSGCSGRNAASIRLPPLEESAEEVSHLESQAPIELETGSANVVRLIDPATESLTGTLEVTGDASVLVFIDDRAPLMAPVLEDLPVGTHEIRITCPDATTQTYRVVVEPGTTVSLQVCGLQRP